MGIMDMFQDPGTDSTVLSSAMNSSSSFQKSGKNLVFCLAGDSVISKHGIHTQVIHDLSSLFQKLQGEGSAIAIVVGGGRVERKFRKSAKELSGNEFFSDQTVMHVSKAAASLFVHSIPSAHSKVLDDVHSAKSILNSNQIAIYGTVLPGVSVEGTAALLAEKLNAKLFILSDADGVYSGSKGAGEEEAQLISNLSFSDVSESAGILDGFTSSIVSRSKIETYVLNANSASNIEQCVRGSSFTGTKISEVQAAAPVDYGLQGLEGALSEGLEL